jgi:hypothetical protein
MDDWPLPTVVDFSHVGNVSTFGNIPATATAEIARSSQLIIPSLIYEEGLPII